MIKFNLPGFYEHLSLNVNFLELLNKHPEYLRDNVEIESVYGNFQFCIFDGGRVFNNKYRQTSKEEIINITNKYNIELGIPIRLIYTNAKVPEDQYVNRFANIVLSLCENNINQIVVNDKGLEQYIKNNYPKYKLISSTTKCLTDLNAVKNEINNKDYYLTCLDYNLNQNLDFLKTFTQEEKNKTEILVNAICPPNCPYRKEHYDLNSDYSLSYGKDYDMDKCLIRHSLMDPITLNSKNNLTPDMIINTYEPLGFSHFKIEGRTLSDIDVACAYVYYMIKPEYQLLVLSILFQNVHLENI